MVLDREHIINSDLMCGGCGYNLRGMSCQGHCPECGVSIGAGFAAVAAIGQPQEFIKIVSRTKEASLTGTAFAVIFVVSCLSLGNPPIAIFGGLMMVVCGVIHLVMMLRWIDVVNRTVGSLNSVWQGIAVLLFIIFFIVLVLLEQLGDLALVSIMVFVPIGTIWCIRLMRLLLNRINQQAMGRLGGIGEATGMAVMVSYLATFVNRMFFYSTFLSWELYVGVIVLLLVHLLVYQWCIRRVAALLGGLEPFAEYALACDLR